MEKIICAAVRYENKVWYGHRHMYAMDAQRDELSYEMSRKEMNMKEVQRDQGFVTSEGRYVDREEGWDIAMKAGQINERDRNSIGTLYSEDLY
jgi:hypothetical protein